MINLAKAILEGNLTRDPEIKKTKSNKSVTTFTLALNHEWGAKDGNKAVSYIQIETWEKLAENCAEYLKKGSRALVDGALRQDRWQDEDGKPQSRVKVVAYNVHFLSKPAKGEKEALAA